MLAIASLKAIAGIAGFLWGQDPSEFLRPLAIPVAPHLVYVLIFGAAGGMLTVTGRRDRRAIYLGACFVVIASLYSSRLILGLAAVLPPLPAVGARLLKGLEVDAFLAYLLWLFVREFPTPQLSFSKRRFFTLGIILSAITGVCLFTANLILTIQTVWDVQVLPQAALERFSRHGTNSLYYAFVLAFALAALLALLWRSQDAEPVDRRRIRLFSVALLVGAGPMFLAGILSSASPPYRQFLQDHPRIHLARTIFVHASFLSIPFTTAYAVLVHRVLDVRLVARQAVQYALAKYTTGAAALAPFIMLCAYFYSQRHQPLVNLFGGTRWLLLASATALGVAALQYRRSLLDTIDRRFFREQYDARQILSSLVEKIRDSTSPRRLAELVTREIDRALHLETIAILLEDPHRGLLSDPSARVRPLDASSPLAVLVCATIEPLALNLEDPQSPLANLPEDERHWLVDGRFELLLPIVGSDGTLLGIIALGPKKSHLPFLKEDRQLLSTIAASAALAIELDRLRSTREPPTPTWEPLIPEPGPSIPPPRIDQVAKECPECRRLYPADTEECSRCRQPLKDAMVPYVLPGRIRFEERLGSGGMGVVYRASDLALGRPVAIKTLPRVSPEEAMRLRREARAAAAVTHRNLALIYGLETWHGTPLLLLEFLEGGNLAKRLQERPFSPREMVGLGIAMAEALDRIHDAGILHRDIKPSNIGFARDGTPKLLDFGIARIQYDLRKDVLGLAEDLESTADLPPTAIWDQSAKPLTGSKQLVGTLAYLCPEALNGAPPDPSFDLWALSVVLLEALAGQRVFSSDNFRRTVEDVRLARIPNLAEFVPECPPPLLDFFQRALHRDRSRRPATAREMHRELKGIQSMLFG